MLLSNMLSELHLFGIMFMLCCPNSTMFFPPLDADAVICDTEVPCPMLLLQCIEKNAVGAETADLVSTFCHCAACICGNHASKGRDR